MKSFVVAMVLLAVLVAALFGYNAFLRSRADALLSDTVALQASVETENWEDAFHTMDSLKEKWATISKQLAVVIEHNELDNIMLRMAEVEQYTHGREVPELLAELAALSELIDHISTKEQLTIQNVL